MTETVGEQLRNARVQRNLSLEQVEKNTRIRKVFLEALENNQPENLPSPVQGKGFLRLYAGFLNLDAAPLLALWDGISANPDLDMDKVQVEKKPAVKPVKEDTQQANKSRISPDNSPLTESIPLNDSSLQALPSVPEQKSSHSQQIFKQIGEILINQRLILGLSQDEVEKFTHVRSRYIQALESGNIGDLPSPVQGRGMLNNYALFLNLDADALLLKFAEALQDRRLERMSLSIPAQPISKKKSTQKTSSISRWLTTDLLAGGGIILFLIGFTIWGAARINSINQNEISESPPPIGKVLLETPTPRLVSPTGINAPSAQVLSEDRAKSPTLPAITGTLPAINDAPVQIYIIARERAFLKIIVDGKEMMNARVVPGNAYAFSGTKQIELLTGSAGALQIYYNQKELGNLGLPGQALNILFTAQGMLTPTATLVPTATPTVPTTRTITPTASQLPPTPTVTLFVP